MSIVDIKKRIAEHCIVNGIDATAERIDLTARIVNKAHGKEKVMLALDSLVVHSRYFPTPATIADEIQKLENKGITSEDKAVLEMERVIKAFSDCGFNPTEIRKELGDDLYTAIGGTTCIDDYGLSRVDAGMFKAQLRNNIKAWLNSKSGENKINTVEKISGVGSVERILNAKSEPKQVDFTKLLPTESE